MEKQLSNNKKLIVTKKMKRPIFVGTFLLSALIFVFGFYLPLVNDVSTAEQQIRLIDAEINKANLIASQLPKVENRVKELDIRLNEALNQLPDKQQISELLGKVADKARDTGLDVKLFKPDEEIKKDFYAEVPVEVSLQGTYHQVASFFDEVGHLDRIVNLDQFSLTDPVYGDDNTLLAAKLKVIAFRFIDETERAQIAQEKEDRSTKRVRRARK